MPPIVAHLLLPAIALVFAVMGRPALAQAIAVDIPLTSGSERALLAVPQNPRATLIMLPGGNGTVDIGPNGAIGSGGGNFLIRTLPLWLAQGFAVEILGAPQNASLMGQRHTAAYAAAIDRAIDFAQSRVNAPVWLVGTSQGAIAGVNGAAHLAGKLAGVVLTSPVSGPSASGETVFDAEPQLIAIPALVVVNAGDGCRSSPPGAAQTIASYLARSPRKDVIVVQSSEARSDPCQAMSPHGFLGIEAQVVQQIAGWIR